MPTPLQSAMPPDTRRPPPERTRERGAPLPVVDPHVRLGDASTISGSGADALAPLRELLDRRGGCHLLRAVHVQADLPWEDALADVARVQGIARTPGSGGLPNGVVACVDLAAGDVDARLDALTRHPNVRGVRPPAGARLPTDLAPLERRGLVLELDADAVPVGDVVWLATAHPDCRIVLVDTGVRAKEHETKERGAKAPGTDASGATRSPGGAGPAAADDVDERRRASSRRLGPLGNVVLKLACRGAADTPEAHASVGARIERALEAVGPDRVLLASGAARSDDDLPWHAAWQALAVAARGIPASRRDALFRTNAVRTYRL